MRGTFKQIFLRVSADGEEICTSTNLKVQQQNKTLSITVEYVRAKLSSCKYMLIASH